MFDTPNVFSAISQFGACLHHYKNKSGLALARHWTDIVGSFLSVFQVFAMEMDILVAKCYLCRLLNISYGT